VPARSTTRTLANHRQHFVERLRCVCNLRDAIEHEPLFRP